ncbi:GNAT family N-acetyltransferase [Gammaproteobacteria bacterium]|nr:GNAT family N-acetyltransferase [Gammaproteobacteria bacterium]
MIDIREVNINNTSHEMEIIELINLVFSKHIIAKGYLKKYIQAKSSSQPSLFLCAFENNEMIACNAFIANDFLFKKKLSVCYQSCWSATHPEHRGKGAFIKIQEEAKKILKEKGALLIYGLPNSISRPIFKKKLYFSEHDSLITRIPNLPFIRSLWLRGGAKKKYSSEDTLISQENQIVELKRNLNPEIIEIKFNSSLAWGKISSRKKIGYEWKVFCLGGIDVRSDEDFLPLLKKIFKQKCHFVEIVSCGSNGNNCKFRFWKNIEETKFIFFFLNEDQSKFKNFNLMHGVADTF